MLDETPVAPAPQAVTPDSAPVAPSTPAPVAAPYDWKGLNLSPELQHVVDRHQFDHPSTVLKSYDSLERFHGVPPDRLLKLPDAKDPADAWKPIFQKMGMPETADKYVVPVPDGDNGEFAKVARDWFHGANMTQSQVTKLTDQWNGFQASRAKSQQDAILERDTTDVSELKKAWGSSYEENAQLVDKVRDAVGMSDAFLDNLKKAGGPKEAMEVMYKIGKMFGVEDHNVPGIGNTGFSTTMTPEMAKAEMHKLKNDKNYAQLLQSPDPRTRMEVRERMTRLAEMAYPGTTEVG